MNEEVIIFRVDSSVELGWGHTKRCLNIAKEFDQKGYKILFIAMNYPMNINYQIEEYGYKLIEISPNNEGEIELIQSITRHYRRNILLIDCPNYTYNDEVALYMCSDLLVAISDVPRKHYVDIIINNNYGAECESIYINQKKIKKLLGVKYLTVREDINNSLTREKNVVHLYFGGNDYLDHTSLYARLLLERDSNLKVFAVVSIMYKYEKNLKRLKKQYPNQFNYIINPKNMSLTYQQTFIALGAPGISTWERMANGLPGFYLATNINQIPILKKLESHGLVAYLGEAGELSAVLQVEKFLRLIKNNNFILTLKCRGEELIDGKGNLRIMTNILNVQREV